MGFSKALPARLSDFIYRQSLFLKELRIHGLRGVSLKDREPSRPPSRAEQGEPASGKSKGHRMQADRHPRILLACKHEDFGLQRSKESSQEKQQFSSSHGMVVEGDRNKGVMAMLMPGSPRESCPNAEPVRAAGSRRESRKPQP